jgi:hypothetical protein
MDYRPWLSSRWFIQFAALAILAPMGIGCTPALSLHPLSDEKTSVADERLIGHWRLLDPENRDDPDTPRFVVGRLQDAKNTLEWVFTDVAQDGTVKIYRCPLFSTSIADHRYLSLQGPHDDDPGYLIFQYELIEHDAQNDEDDELKLFALKIDVLAKAIEDEKLPGIVKYHQSPGKRTADNPFKEKYQYVRTSAPAEKLIAYIKKHERELFDEKRPIVLKRGRSLGL